MKHIATVALVFNLGAACIYAQQRPVSMTFSGNGAPNAIDMKYPNTSTDEENVAGSGTFGQFTFRDLRAASNSPQPSATCSATFFPSVAGGAVFRFQDGNLMTATLTGGGDCIDFVHMTAHCTLTFKITGGTGRFAGATGNLTYSETPGVVFLDSTGVPVLTTETGEITGTISGVGPEDVRENGQG